MTAPSLNHILRQAAIFGEKRHEVLTGNVANVDTPNYRTRDLDLPAFHELLEHSINLRRNPEPSPSIGELAHPYLVSKPNAVQSPTLAAPTNITFQDANNRSIEREMTELSKNFMRQSFLIQVMSAQFSQLEAVISERI